MSTRKELMELLKKKMGLIPGLIHPSPIGEPEEEEVEEEDSEEDKVEPKLMRLVVMYSKAIDKVHIISERKGRVLEVRGTKEGLKKIEHPFAMLTPINATDIETLVEETLIVDVDYNVEFDVDVDSGNQADDIIREWAVAGVYPKDAGGGWFDGNAKRDWNAIDRGLE